MSDIQSINTTASEPAIQSGEGSEAAPVSENRQRLNELAQQLASAVQRKRALVGKVDTMQRAKQAAQGDAAAARQQWGAKLRDSDGTLTRDIQKLRANERSALSLAEEYEAMEGEIAAELPRLELELAEVAERCLGARNTVTWEVADQAYEQLLAQTGDSLAFAFALFSRATNSADADELASQFFGRLGNAVRRRLDDDAVTAQMEDVLALPSMDLSEVDMQLVHSTIRRIQLRAQISVGDAA
ncbi:hypothetical protein [Stenotrophomonas maltophilia]|uniref:hypothetical protein n=1 Tax=Stenotrophomonas maltophilia TaxID=40324 RepID=UPI0015DF9740|nr:hypothetical protein [Stenotrophomonas maltophilia]MBA0240958.1 hypothetical protein [Stenotrophomonas maltophilia]MBH1714807.1 hypothetical protein [Stenotrophomonas maltophilia]HEL3173205.1 hypothetical protein [Stenotrophomonas maltophilia]HEL4245954.1 hypothetical protein [Stenotrophomonas maltophilia]